MADTQTLRGTFSVLINDGFTWACYEIEAASEAAAHACARALWAMRGERGKGDRPEGMAEDYAAQVGGHKVPEPEPDYPSAEQEAALADTGSATSSSAPSSTSKTSATSGGSSTSSGSSTSATGGGRTTSA